MREWYRNYPSVGCGGTGDRKGRPYGPDKGSLCTSSGALRHLPLKGKALGREKYGKAVR